MTTADHEKFWFASPGGFLGLINTPFGAFLSLSKVTSYYVYIVVFYGAEFKFTIPNT